jgi:hypothetical protein
MPTTQDDEDAIFGTGTSHQNEEGAPLGDEEEEEYGDEDEDDEDDDDEEDEDEVRRSLIRSSRTINRD